MKYFFKQTAVISGIIFLLLIGSTAVSAALDPGVETQAAPVVTGRQLLTEKITFLVNTLKDRVAPLPVDQRPELVLGESFFHASGFTAIASAVLNPDHPLYAAVAKAGELHQRAQVRPALTDDAHRYLNLATLDTLDELLAAPNLDTAMQNTLFALIDLLKELELPEAYQAPDTRYTFTGVGRPDDRDRTERGALISATEENPASATGFRYYGRPYSLATDISVDSRGFIVFGDGQVDTDGIDIGALTENSIPAMLSPLVFMPTGNKETDVDFAYRAMAMMVMPSPVSLTIDYVRRDVSDLRHTFNWTVKADDITVMNTSASLYRNDWIVFDYPSVDGEGGDYLLYTNIAQGAAGLSPGDGSVGSGHPGEGEPRDWTSGADFIRTLENNGSLPFTEGEYTALYSDANLSLADWLYIFRPYEWDDNGVFKETPSRYTVTAGSREILAAGLVSLDEAIGYVIDDRELLKAVDDGAFLDDALQAAISGDPTSAPGYDLIQKSAFMAYAVQVEEDIVNREIARMYNDALNGIAEEKWRIRDAVESAAAYSQIKTRDAWFTQNADAKAGRVLRDRHGDWVRVQQYVVRPTDNSVQFLSASLRNDNGAPALSTLAFATVFAGDGGALPGDLTTLPWSDWLNTIEKPYAPYVSAYAYEIPGSATTLKYVESIKAPVLESMTVTLQNPGRQTFQEQRTFYTQQNFVQFVKNETLNLAGEQFENRYDITFFNGNVDSASVALDYTVGDYAAGAFQYEFTHRDDPVHVSLFELTGNWASPVKAKDIWDALRVEESGGPAFKYGGQALEIVVEDGAQDAAFEPFDVLYIPMSHMIWKNESS